MKIGQKVLVDGKEGKIREIGTVSSKVEFPGPNGIEIIQVANTSITIITFLMRLVMAIKNLIKEIKS